MTNGWSKLRGHKNATHKHLISGYKNISKIYIARSATARVGYMLCVDCMRAQAEGVPT